MNETMYLISETSLQQLYAYCADNLLGKYCDAIRNHLSQTTSRVVDGVPLDEGHEDPPIVEK